MAAREGFSVGDKITFYSVEDDGTMVGITEGGVYRVVVGQGNPHFGSLCIIDDEGYESGCGFGNGYSGKAYLVETATAPATTMK